MKTPDEVESVFYEAFMHRDQDVMEALWNNGKVVCVHPGSRGIVGYDAVIRSWKHILQSSQQIDIRYQVESKSVSDELAVHVVTEEILENNVVLAMVIATNVYQKFNQGWLMIEHHGSVANAERKSETLQ